MIRASIAFLFLAFPFASSAQISPQWLRYPAISPDGRTIAFAFQGDLYTVPSSGGMARPLTRDGAIQNTPVWSRDGKRIAFAGNNAGNFDIYIINATEKDSAKRLTWHSTDEYPYDFSADDKDILFGAARMDAPSNRQFPSEALPELYTVPSSGGRIRQMLTTTAENARISGDGKFLIYHDRKGRENPWRKHQLSSVARDIWLYDIDQQKHRQLSSFAGEDRNPVFSSDENSVYYLSERSGSFNVYSVLLNNTSSWKQVTFFKNDPVRFLSISKSGTLCFGYDGQIYIKRKNAPPARVAVKIPGNDNKSERLTIPVGEVQDMAVSPSGKEVAFAFRGEIFAAAVIGNTVKQITHTAELESKPVFSPDGKQLLYASERNGRWQIVRASFDGGDVFCNASSITETSLIDNGHENSQPQFSHDGKEVAYIEDRTRLKIYNISSRNARDILVNEELYSRHDNDQYFEWSPDDKWMLVQYTERGVGNDEVGVISTSGNGKLINVTKSGYSDARPRWSMNGKMISWLSDRQGLHSYANSGTSQTDVYGSLVLNNDWEGMRERKRKLSAYSSLLADALLSSDEKYLYYLTKPEKNYELWVTDIAAKSSKMLLPLNASGAEMEWDAARKYIFILANGKIMRYDPTGRVSHDIVARTEISIDPARERAAMFEHVWRRTKETFYEKNMHGTDWDRLKQVYKKYLDGINNNYDFSEMLNELLGELNVSHTGASWTDPRPGKEATASLGALYDQQYGGNGAKISEVLPGGPLDSASLDIQPGDIIEAIDSQIIGPDKNMEQFLNQKAGKPVTLTIARGNERKNIVVGPVTQETETDLVYNRWVKRNQRETDSISNGGIGYVHLYRMNDAAYRNVYEDVLGKYAKCRALIVDTRFNRGGDLATELTMFLTGISLRQNVAGEFLVSTEPVYRWTKPSVVLVNEANYSDGHCFAYDYKYLHLGKLVGMPVPGSCTWMSGETLLDNSMHYSVPTMGVKTLDGVMMENQQTKPDIQVANDYSSVSRGIDRQLEAAITEMKQELLNKK